MFIDNPENIHAINKLGQLYALKQMPRLAVREWQKIVSSSIENKVLFQIAATFESLKYL